MAITALPTPPSRAASPATFSDDADAFLGALPTFQVEANDLASDVNTKQTQSATSASAAATSATQAASSATSASTSASNANTSRTQAATSATQAAASATNAANSATSASTSATSASSSASTATTKASEANTSASNAAASATSAANSASTASSKATEASSSASSAATSATNAANSASSAATSASTSLINAQNAAAATTAPLWSVSTNYSAGALVWSSVNGRIYRRLSAGVGGSDPSINTIDWVLLSVVVEQTDIGTGPNEIPLNQYLGNMAFMNNDVVVLKPPANITPQQIGSMVFQLTSNTSLTIKVKGSDGTVRSASITLA